MNWKYTYQLVASPTIVRRELGNAVPFNETTIKLLTGATDFGIVTFANAVAPGVPEAVNETLVAVATRFVIVASLLTAHVLAPQGVVVVWVESTLAVPKDVA